MVKKDMKDEFREIASFISGLGKDAWEVETIIPAHGDLVRQKPDSQILKDHFSI